MNGSLDSKKTKSLKLLKALPIGALFYTFSSVAVKGVGALYKIPLAGLIGAEGAGLYQMIFPLYALLLTVSGASVPTALTRIIGGGYDKKAAIKKSLVLFLSAGALLSAALFVFAPQIAEIQGNKNAAPLYRIISPALLICSVIAVLRGALQGGGTFFYTAVSQIVEQCVKAALGLTFIRFFGGDVYTNVKIAVAAVVFSEIVAFLYLLICFFKRSEKSAATSEEIKKSEKTEQNDKIEKGKNECDEIKRKKSETNPSECKNFTYRTLLFYVAPLCLTGLIMPLSAFFDSFIAINALKINFSNSTALYGAFAGGSETIIGLFVGAITAFATACLPVFCKKKSAIKKIFAFCAVISALSAAAIFVFSDLITEILFSRFNEYKPLISSLLKASAANVVFQSTLAVSNVILLSIDSQFYSVFSMFIGLIIKVVLNVLLIKNPQINLFGLVISDSCFYLVALGLNLGYIIYRKTKEKRQNVFRNNDSESENLTSDNKEGLISDEDNFNRLGQRQGRTVGKRVNEN